MKRYFHPNDVEQHDLGDLVFYSDALAAIETARKDHEAEAYWRERIAGELEVGEAMKASALGPFYRTFTSAAAFVRGNKREDKP